MDQELYFQKMQHDIGNLDGRMCAIERAITDLSEVLKQIAANETRLSHLERDRIQHEKRIVELENELRKWEHLIKSVESMLEQIRLMETRCAKHAHRAEAIDQHLKNDKSVDIIAGEWALRFLMLLGGALGIWLWDRTPKILELLR